MLVNMAQRGSSTTLVSSNRSALQLRRALARHPTRLDVQSRTLWWWGRRRNHWLTTLDEEMEERMQRQHKILAQRYHRVLRRRAIWESDNNSCTPWALRLSRGRIGRKDLSSGKPNCANVKDREDKLPKNSREWETFHQVFETWKKEVDTAIDRDAYGTLFGRRLQSPPSANPWTSFSWFWDTTETKDPSSPAKASKDFGTTPSPKPVVVNNAPSPAAAPTSETKAIKSEAEYVYDPISGRNVPKVDSVINESLPKVPLLRTLFAEHGVEIPVKPYKPHKVYGYNDKDSSAAVAQTPDKAAPVKKRYENSRAAQLQSLRASTLGTNIDTTAEFGGKYQPLKEAVEPPPPGNKHRGSGEPDENAPLFSGTAYESRLRSILKNANQRSHWLQKEGFNTASDENQSVKATRIADHNNEKPADTSAIDIPVKTYKDRLQTSLERLSTKAEPSTMGSPQPGNTIITKPSSPSDKEIDRLKPSDVRAATKAAIKGKADTESRDYLGRSNTRPDITSTQHHSASSSSLPESFRNATDITKSLANVWEHVKKFPQGIVAKTMDKIGVSDETWKKYSSSDKSDLLEKREFGKEVQAKTPTIFKTSGQEKLKMFEPSQEVLLYLRERTARQAALKKANEAAAKVAEERSVQASKLAGQIREVYEAQYGKIDEHHRQNPSASDTQPGPAILTKTTALSSTTALKSASVKPGCEQNPAIVQHTEIFEPKLAKAWDDLKSIHRQTKDATERVDALSISILRRRREDVLAMLEREKKRSPLAVAASKPLRETSEPSRAETISGTNRDVGTIRSSPAPSKNASHLLLTYDIATQTVRKTPVTLAPSIDKTTRTTNLADILAGLSRSDQYLQHFAEVESAGYELLSGGRDLLVFRKRAPETTTIPAPQIQENATANKIAAEEIAAQPNQSTSSPKEEATSALDKTSTEAGLSSSPAAHNISATLPRSSQGPKVKRQENVFSGTMKPIAGIQGSDSHEQSNTYKPGFFARLVRGVRSAVLVVLGLGVGAYVVGVVAEGLGAQAQQQNGLEKSQAQGPRKRVVVTGQRPGIYSTESSR